jgi:hypothetical protein
LNRISNREARAAKRAAAAAKRKEEVERRRREREEQIKREKEELERQEVLRKEMEMERRRREEERRSAQLDFFVSLMRVKLFCWLSNCDLDFLFIGSRMNKRVPKLKASLFRLQEYIMGG